MSTSIYLGSFCGQPFSHIITQALLRQRLTPKLFMETFQRGAELTQSAPGTRALLVRLGNAHRFLAVGFFGRSTTLPPMLVSKAGNPILRIRPFPQTCHT